ncbi:HAD-IIIA family hydrolase [Streptomyces sp. CB01881]|uniref:HAD-IIIA family hydrolase n=1 Tax=Streptomyces sp. CB01881 TaxID=2078691 RepID=UPI0011E0505B|nr:HAD-IIIA family hydrolase [Streptomyces sp. CB01881]TYC66730.1 HAD-IIIA family hydrolase [Streptomyces sp. CB01881]
MAYLGEPATTVPQPRTSGNGTEHSGPWLFARAAGGGTDGPAGAVLFGRDGTLLQDVSYNGDPAMVRPMTGVRAALAALRGAGFALGVVSNQPGVARGLIGHRHVEAVQDRAEALLGAFDVWAVCPHGPYDGCRCRMPAPTLVTAACEALGLPPSRVTVIACSDSVVAAALTAGAHAIRVPDAIQPATAPYPPCTLATCRSAAGPAQAADLLMRRLPVPATAARTLMS